MSETASRLLFAAETVLFGVPTMLIVCPEVIPAAFSLTPIALYGLVQTLIQDGPSQSNDLWTGSELLGMALLGSCSVVAIVYLLRLGSAFLRRGRTGLAGKTKLLRRALLWALPPLSLWSVPRLYKDTARDTAVALLLQGGLPLLIPAAHLMLEMGLRQTSHEDPSSAN